MYVGGDVTGRLVSFIPSWERVSHATKPGALAATVATMRPALQTSRLPTPTADKGQRDTGVVGGVPIMYTRTSCPAGLDEDQLLKL
jgi:hypothetical protein